MNGGVQLRKPYLKRTIGASCSRTSLDARVLPHSSGMNQRKKVKFADSAKELEKNHKNQPSSLTEGTEGHNSMPPLFKLDPLNSAAIKVVPAVDELKTLEYRSFKRLWEETCQAHSTQLHLKDNNLKTLEASDPAQELMLHSRSRQVCERDLPATNLEESYGTVACAPVGNRSSLPLGKVTPISRLHLLSPSKGSRSYDEYINGRSDPHPSYCSLFKHQKTAVASEADDKHGEIFSSKREAIIQFASKALSLEISELKSGRLDIIAEFLRRLGITKRSNKVGELAMPLEKQRNDLYLPQALPKPDGQYGELHENREVDLIPTNMKESLEKDFFASWHVHADECIHGPRNTEGDDDALFTRAASQISELPVSSRLGGHLEDMHEAVGKGLVSTASKGPLGINLLSPNRSKDCKLILPSCGSLENVFSAWQRISETRLQHDRRQCSWLLNNGKISDTHYLTFYEEPSIKFERSRCDKQAIDRFLADFLDMTPRRFNSRSFFPHFSPVSLKVTGLLSPDPQSEPAKKHCILPVLGWRDEDIEAEEGSSVTSDRHVRFESDDWSLISGSNQGELSYSNQMKSVFASSFLFKGESMASDASDEDLDVLVSSPRPDFDIKCESWDMEPGKISYSPIYFKFENDANNMKTILDCMPIVESPEGVSMD